MSFGQSISKCFSNYANFNGRAGRPEFWWFALFVWVVQLVANGLLSVTLGNSSTLYNILVLIIGVVLLIPFYAAGSRRMHDTGQSGWFQLLVLIPCVGIIIMIVLWAKEGDAAENQYGAPPA